jgi:hypothetical protein
MSRFEAMLLHVANVLVGGTGLVYAWVRYVAAPSDPFAVVNRPWQPQVQHLHVLLAPLLVFATGMIWRRHVLASWREEVRRRHRSGSALAWMLVPMIASGYLLQTAVDDRWRRAWVVVHLATSGLWIAGYLAHQIGARIAERRRAARSARAA